MFLGSGPRVGVVWALFSGLCLSLSLPLTCVAQEAALLEARDIFITTAKQVSAREVVFDYVVPPRHALERHHFRFDAGPQVIAKVIYPPTSASVGNGHTQYRQNVRIRVLLAKGQGHTGEITATAQGCDLSLAICYLPFQHVQALKWP